MSEETSKEKQQGGVSMDVVSRLLEQQAKQHEESMVRLLEEVRKPAALTEDQEEQLDKKKRQKAQDLQMRKDQAGLIIQQMKNREAYQKICTHEHPKREGGATHCVFVQDQMGGYVLCQEEHCGIRVRPENQNKKLDPKATYNTPLFNKLYQDCAELS
jgi:hypothetical protein